MRIPVELCEQIQRGQVILILGPEINLGESGEPGLPTFAELARELAERLGYQEADLNFQRVAQHYELEHGRHALITYLKDRFSTSSTSPLAAHRLLACLPFRVIVTTCLDNRLEWALKDADRPFIPVIRNADIPYEEIEKLLLVKIYGDLEQPDSLILTETDHRRCLSELSTISDVLKGLLASRTLLLLGHDLDDANIKDLYDRVMRNLDRHARRSYVFYQNASAYAVAFWEKHNKAWVKQAELTALLRQIEHQFNQPVAKNGRPFSSKTDINSESVETIPRRPYKFLNAFQAEDATIFFGREREKIKLLSKLMSYRLLLFYGKSGVGKTSLINAGVIPELAAHGYHPVYARISTNPSYTILRAINTTSGVPFPEQATLHAYLQQVNAPMEEVLILFIDQFEELFTQVDAETRSVFIQEIARIYTDTQLKLKLILSFREDYLAEFNVFLQDIPDIFNNYYRLERLTQAQAREAITGPVQLCGIHYESELLDRLLLDLGTEAIDPPQLQIVCDSLYEALQPDETCITTELYERLGGTRVILSGYLDQVLKHYTSEERLLIQKLLKAFITSVDTKAVLTVDHLASRAGLAVERVQKTLDELLRARLVRRAESEIQYELSHEYLVNQIASWMK